MAATPKKNMKINQKLIEAADFNPTRTTELPTIEILNSSIAKGEITLPLYQRDLSWTKEKYIDLLNYELLGYAPVSAISANIINDLSKAVPQVTFVERELIDNIEKGTKSIVDGQQRLTTNYLAYIDSDEFKDIVLDLGKGEFIQRDLTKPLTAKQIPVGVLLYKDSSKLDAFVNNSPLGKGDAYRLLLKIRAKFNAYAYTMNYAKDLDEAEQINWFEVLNNAGSRVSLIQMKFSKLKVEGIDIYNDYTRLYVETLETRGYENVFLEQKTRVSYPVAALNASYEVLINEGVHNNNFSPMSSDTKENHLCSLEPWRLKECFRVTLEALDKSLDFIEENGLQHPDRVDYINFLIGYFVFHKDQETYDIDYLIDWYKTVNFRNKSNTARRQMYTNLVTH